MITALPTDGFLRLKQLLELVPMSSSTWRQGVADGRYPAPVKLGPKIVAWRVTDIRVWMASTQEVAPNQP